MKTVTFCALGCRVNQYEIQALREQFAKAGYAELKFGEKCDFCIINTCAVTKESEKKSRSYISRASRCADAVVITGCYAALCRMVGKTSENVFYCGGCGEREKILSVCEGIYAGYAENTAYEPLVIGTTGKLPNERYRAFVKIEDGCNGRCAYCIIPKLRGKAFNRPESDVLEEVARLAQGGVSEVILTGIEVSDYGMKRLADLIIKVADIDGIKRIRLGSVNPGSVSPYFIQTVKNCEKFCRHIHLSVQSASDGVLKAMRRPYGAAKLNETVDMLYGSMPDILVTADIISGFPGETEEQFEETCDFVKRSRIMHVHAFPYSPRPFTEAADMPMQIAEDVKKRRNARMIELSDRNKSQIAHGLFDSVQTVLVEKNVRNEAFGHTEGFMESRITNSRAKPGEYVECRVTGFDGALVCEEI